VVLMDTRSKPYDASNDVMKSTFLKISNDDIAGRGRPINSMSDSRVGFGDDRLNATTFDWTSSRV